MVRICGYCFRNINICLTVEILDAIDEKDVYTGFRIIKIL